MARLAILFQDAGQLLAKARTAMDSRTFRNSVRQLEVGVAQLPDAAIAGRISTALGSVGRWDFLDLKNPHMRKNLVVPEIENLVAVIHDQLSLSARQPSARLEAKP